MLILVMRGKSEFEKSEMNYSDLKRWIYLAGGYGSFVIGLIGIVLPVLPTIIFWIMALACFSQSSPKMAERILNWPGIGPALSDYADHRIIQPKSKVMAVIGMSLAAIVIMLSSIPALIGVITISVIAAAGVYVCTRPSSRDFI